MSRFLSVSLICSPRSEPLTANARGKRTTTYKQNLVYSETTSGSSCSSTNNVSFTEVRLTALLLLHGRLQLLGDAHPGDGGDAVWLHVV